MAPDQRGEVGDVVVVDIHAFLPDVANGLLHVDGVPVDDGIEGEAQGAKLLLEMVGLIATAFRVR